MTIQGAGVRDLIAFALGAIIGDIHRFAHPRQLMTYLGLVSVEHSSGPRQHLGGATEPADAS